MSDRLVEARRNELKSLWTRMWRYSQRICGDESLAEDIAQEAYFDAWRNAPAFEGRSSFATWVFAIVRFKTLTALRRKRSEHASYFELDVSEIEDTMVPADVFLLEAEAERIRGERLDAILRVFPQLSHEHQEVMSRYYIRGERISDIAHSLGVLEITVRTRLHYARKHLRELLLPYMRAAA